MFSQYCPATRSFLAVSDAWSVVDGTGVSRNNGNIDTIVDDTGVSHSDSDVGVCNAGDVGDAPSGGGVRNVAVVVDGIGGVVGSAAVLTTRDISGTDDVGGDSGDGVCNDEVLVRRDVSGTCDVVVVTIFLGRSVGAVDRSVVSGAAGGGCCTVVGADDIDFTNTGIFSNFLRLFILHFLIMFTIIDDGKTY